MFTDKNKNNIEIKSLIVVIDGIIILSGSMFFLNAMKQKTIDNIINVESDKNPAVKDIRENLRTPML